jgi:uncharacterized protein (TIGR00288 family)
LQNKEKIAVFIDADNAPAGKIDTIMSEFARYGVVNIRKAYGNWKNANLKSWEEVLHDYSIQPIQQFDLVKGKNATDMALTIDVMDILYTRNIDIICLVSSDCDFTPLVTRALADGKTVIGFGERKAPMPFVNCCSRFLYLDEPSASAAENPDRETPQPAQSNRLKGNSRLITLLRQAIEAVQIDNGWARLNMVGTHISNHTSFDQRNYGFSKLSDLFAAIDLFELKKSDGNIIWVRDKKTKKTTDLPGQKRSQ